MLVNKTANLEVYPLLAIASKTFPEVGEWRAVLADSTRRIEPTSLNREVRSLGTSVVVRA
jgi:hypothetical protein